MKFVSNINANLELFLLCVFSGCPQRNLPDGTLSRAESLAPRITLASVLPANKSGSCSRT
jgi:hypothetical protein